MAHCTVYFALNTKKSENLTKKGDDPSKLSLAEFLSQKENVVAFAQYLKSNEILLNFYQRVMKFKDYNFLSPESLLISAVAIATILGVLEFLRKNYARNFFYIDNFLTEFFRSKPRFTNTRQPSINCIKSSSGGIYRKNCKIAEKFSHKSTFRWNSRKGSSPLLSNYITRVFRKILCWILQLLREKKNRLSLKPENPKKKKFGRFQGNRGKKWRKNLTDILTDTVLFKNFEAHCAKTSIPVVKLYLFKEVCRFYSHGFPRFYSCGSQSKIRRFFSCKF